ncbi:MAG: hypothetical protein KAG56_10530, partial [Sulfurovaceae bacterium]|nr:hypothetical protein [Sulfurovaceae bacterium]
MNKISLSLLLSNLLFAQNIELEDITITSTIKEQSQEQEIFQKESFMPKAPMQQQMTTQQALDIAGSNGDPIKALSSLAGIVSTSNDSG